MSRIAVIGAGFRGFCDALALSNAGHSVTIIDSAPFFGGIMNSIQLGNFTVDKGVHFFNSMPSEIIETVTEIMEGQVRPIGYWSRSVFDDVVTENFSLPNLDSRSDNEKEKFLFELVQLAAEDRPISENGNLQQYFDSNFGPSIGKIYGDIFEGIYRTKAIDSEKRAVKQTSLHRTKFLNDEAMMALKNVPWLDDRLAARRKALGKIDDLTSVYPSDGNGMKGWCERAHNWLEKKGVQVLLGEKISDIKTETKAITVSIGTQQLKFDRVVWSNDDVDDLTKMMQHNTSVGAFLKGTPLVFYSIVTKASKIREFTYHQNFDPSAAMFRAAAAGYYGNQVDKDGNSFVTIECTANKDSSIWADPSIQIDAIWAECKRDEIVDKDAEIVKCDFVKIPTSYKIRLNGYNAEFEETCDWISNFDNRIVVRKEEPFFRREIYLDSLQLPDLLDSI